MRRHHTRVSVGHGRVKMPWNFLPSFMWVFLNWCFLGCCFFDCLLLIGVSIRLFYPAWWKNKILELPHDITLASHLLILEIIQSYSNLKFTWGLSCVWEYLDFFFLFFLPSSKAKFNAIRCLNYFFQWEMFFSYLIKLKMWLLRYTFFKWGPQFNFLPCLVPKLCLFTSASDPWSVLGFNIALVIHVFSVVLLCNHGLYFCDICTMHLTV